MRNGKGRAPAEMRGQGSGSGSSMYVLAMSLCRHVDIFGFGIFRGGPEANHGAGGIVEDIRYAHFYDSHPHHWKDGGHQIMESEMRNELFDALGMWNYIWW